MRARSGLLAILLLLTVIPAARSVSQRQWDLSVEKVTVLPLTGEVQQGQPLTLTVYVRNKESRIFSGVVKLSTFVDGELKLVELWDIGNLSRGSIPIPAGGYTTITTKVATSNLTIGVHDLKVMVEPRDYADPHPEDNSYSMKFSVIPLVEAFIDVDREMVQGREYFVKVHIPNPSGDGLDLRVRLFVNGSEVGAKGIYVPPKSISMVDFPLTPSSAGSLRIEALITKGERPYSRATALVEVRPSCDVAVYEVSVPRKVQKGEVISGRVRVRNIGPSPTRVNVSLLIDGAEVDSQILESIPPGGEGSADLQVPTFNLSVGNHTLTISASPLDAIDLKRANNDHSLSFQVRPLPVSLSASASGDSVEVNLTNVGDVLGTFDVVLLAGEREVDRSSVTLDPGSSQVIIFKDVAPGNYTVTALSYGIAVATASVSVHERSPARSRVSPYWGLVAGTVIALAAYLLIVRMRKRKWPSS